jgi:hypothetical protein
MRDTIARNRDIEEEVKHDGHDNVRSRDIEEEGKHDGHDDDRSRHIEEEVKHDGPDDDRSRDIEDAGAESEEESGEESPDEGGSEAHDEDMSAADEEISDKEITLEEALQQFAIRTRQDIAHNGTQAHTTRVLKTLHATLLRLLPVDVQQRIPRDCRTLHRLAGKEHDPQYFFRDFCPKDHHAFKPDDVDDVRCPKCKADTRYKRNGAPRRRAIYFELEDYVQRMMSIDGLLESQLAWESRQAPPGTYKDAVDGSILRGTQGRIFADVAPADRKHCIGMAMCSDATIVARNRSAQSMTPIVCTVLTLPAAIRKVFTGMYLAAVLPKGAKAQIFLQPVVDMFAAVAPGTAGIAIGDYKFWVLKCWRVDDLGGISAGIRSKQQPAINGACIQCKQQGVYTLAHRTSYYMGAYCLLHLDDAEREALATSYEGEPETAARARTELKPPNMTERGARASARRQEQAGLDKEQKKLEPFHGYNVWCNPPRGLLYFNIILQSINDIFHELANTMRDLLSMMQSNRENSGPMRLKRTRKAYEVKIGRCEKGVEQAFCISKEARQMVDDFVQSGRMRLPSCWPRARYVFAHINRLTCSELIMFAGPLGLYVLQFCDMKPDVRDMFAELIRCLELLQAKVCTNAQLDRLQRRLVLVLAQCETKLPLYWCTMVRHTLLHLVDFIKRCGPYDSFSMSCFERFHTFFKKLVRAKNGEMQSVATHYTMALVGDRADCEQAAKGKPVTGYASTVAGAPRVDYATTTIEVAGTLKTIELAPEILAQVQDYWALRTKAYDRLRDRYRNQVYQQTDLTREEANKMQIPRTWIKPTISRAHTPEELA